jgi:hypothetical protein
LLPQKKFFLLGFVCNQLHCLGEIEPAETIVIKDENTWRTEMQMEMHANETVLKREVFVVCKDKWRNSVRVKDEGIRHSDG